MSLLQLACFLLLVGVGSYTQTITGFAFGLIVMGGVGLTGALSLPDAAVVMSMLVLVNAAQVLWRNWRAAWNLELKLLLGASLPTVVLSYLLLEALAEANLGLLRLLLGLVIVVAAVQLILPNAQLSSRSSNGSFVMAGVAGGILSGLFSTSGPPLVYHLYRQPFALQRIRETLVAVFAINSLVRLGAVAASGNFPARTLWVFALSVPMVIAATHIARRWPPAISPRAMRLVVFALLVASGLSLALPAVVELVAVPA